MSFFRPRLRLLEDSLRLLTLFFATFVCLAAAFLAGFATGCLPLAAAAALTRAASTSVSVGVTALVGTGAAFAGVAELVGDVVAGSAVAAFASGGVADSGETAWMLI